MQPPVRSLWKQSLMYLRFRQFSGWSADMDVRCILVSTIVSGWVFVNARTNYRKSVQPLFPSPTSVWIPYTLSVTLTTMS